MNKKNEIQIRKSSEVAIKRAADLINITNRLLADRKELPNSIGQELQKNSQSVQNLIKLLLMFPYNQRVKLISQNESFPWSIEILEQFEDKWEWDELSKNEGLPWSIALLDRFEGKWQTFFEGGFYNQQGGVSGSSIKWSNSIGLCANKALPWSIELLERFEDKEWDWKELSANEGLPWSLELLERFEDKWQWEMWSWHKKNGLSTNKSLPWSMELIERFEEKWEWNELSANESLPWSIGLLERFEDKWAWRIHRFEEKHLFSKLSGNTMVSLRCKIGGFSDFEYSVIRCDSLLKSTLMLLCNAGYESL